jgi:hypothetical protein
VWCCATSRTYPCNECDPWNRLDRLGFSRCNARCSWIIIGPDTHELVEMMRTENARISCEIVWRWIERWISAYRNCPWWRRRTSWASTTGTPI